MSQQQPSTNSCSVTEFVNNDGDVPICAEFGSEQWEQLFLCIFQSFNSFSPGELDPEDELDGE